MPSNNYESEVQLVHCLGILNIKWYSLYVFTTITKVTQYIFKGSNIPAKILRHGKKQTDRVYKIAYFVMWCQMP